MIYFIQAKDKRIKIGYTGRAASKRLREIDGMNSNTLKLVGVMKGDLQIEQKLHRTFDPFRVKGKEEWYHPEQPLLNLIKKCPLD